MADCKSVYTGSIPVLASTKSVWDTPQTIVILPYKGARLRRELFREFHEFDDRAKLKLFQNTCPVMVDCTR